MSGATFQQGVNGTATLTTTSGTVTSSFNMQVFKWTVAKFEQANDKSGFGDSGQRKVCAGKRAYSFSLAGHGKLAPLTNIVTSGTAYVSLGNGSHVYEGVVVITRSTEANVYNSNNDAPVLLAGEFDGDPTNV